MMSGMGRSFYDDDSKKDPLTDIFDSAEFRALPKEVQDKLERKILMRLFVLLGGFVLFMGLVMIVLDELLFQKMYR